MALSSYIVNKYIIYIHAYYHTQCTYYHICHQQRGETALMIAANVGHTEVVVELVKAKANFDLQDKVCT